MLYKGHNLYSGQNESCNSDINKQRHSINYSRDKRTCHDSGIKSDTLYKQRKDTSDKL